MTCMNEKPRTSPQPDLWVTGFQPLTSGHSGPWLSFHSQSEVWQLHESGEPPSAWVSLGGSRELRLPLPCPQESEGLFLWKCTAPPCARNSRISNRHGQRQRGQGVRRKGSGVRLSGLSTFIPSGCDVLVKQLNLSVPHFPYLYVGISQYLSQTVIIGRKGANL